MDGRTNYASSGDLSIAYRTFGEGEIDLVIVPGFVSHVELLWEHPTTARFMRRLSSFARVITFDKRGQGLSDRPAAPPTLENSMDDLHAVLDAAGSEQGGRVRRLRGRADVDAVRGHVPGAGLVADPLRDLREDDRGARPSLGRPGPAPSTAGAKCCAGTGADRSVWGSGLRR